MIHNWADSFFKPFEHYIPVRADFGDLIAKLNFYNSPEQAETAAKIAAACARRAAEVYDIDHVFGSPE